jgi:[acyl-carrier-protein] S-malonyltransferase
MTRTAALRGLYREGSPHLVFMFPGQTTRYPEMIEKIVAADRESRTVLDQASQVLGRDLAAHYRPGNSAIFACNRDVQIGVFLANHLHLGLLERAGVRAAWSLGLSLGEYNHLVHIGALPFADALRLIEQRGRLYDDGPPGMMVSLFPVEAAFVDRVIDDLGLRQRCAIGLYNSPRQQVLSGERDAIEKVVTALDAEILLDAVEIEPRIPMHAPAFKPVATKFRSVLSRVPFEPPALPYVPNCCGAVMEGIAPDQLRDYLTAHVCEPVRWQASIEAVTARVPSPWFIEVGPGGVLCNLFGRGWVLGRRAHTDAAEDWPRHFHDLTASLRDVA